MFLNMAEVLEEKIQIKTDRKHKNMLAFMPANVDFFYRILFFCTN